MYREVAGIRIYDVQTGQPLQEIAPITKTDDVSITVAISGPMLGGTATGSDVRTLWSMQTVE